MIAVQSEFAAREQEVARYMRFLQEFEEGRVAFTTPPGVTGSMSPADPGALFKTLKANGLLILYNLVESTMTNAIEAIYDELRARAVTFDACRKELREVALKNLKRRDVSKLLPALSSIAVDVLVATFRKEELFSGNVDARLIRDVASEYGFPTPSRKSDEFLTVKASRNDLAHGVKSFAEVGRDFDVARLIQIQQEVIDYLRELLGNIDSYITHQQYLTATTGSP